MMASDTGEDAEPFASSVSSLSVLNNAAVPIATVPSATAAAAQHGTTTKNNHETTTTALDFIGTSNAVKKLFSMSLDASSSASGTSSNNETGHPTTTKKKPTLLAVHNFNGTLIIDDAEDESSYEDYHNSSNNNYNNGHRPYRPVDNRESEFCGKPKTAVLLPPSSQLLALALSNDERQQQQQQSDALSVLSNIVRQSGDRPLLEFSNNSSHREESSNRLLAPPAAPREYLPWKFQDLNLLLGHDTLVVRQPTSSGTTQDGIAVRVEDVEFLRTVWEAFQRQQQQQQQQALMGSNDRLSYAQALLQQQNGGKDHEGNITNAATAELENNSPKKDVSTRTNQEETNDNGDENKSNERFSEVPLQTCIVPFSGPLGGRLSSQTSSTSSEPSPSTTSSLHPADSIGGSSSPALSIVLDAYLDNLIANVPQLALCLQEKGVIQSVKLLPTDDIPSKMLHSSTLDTSRPAEAFPSSSSSSRNVLLEENVFSPQIMEMNASALLRFLKTHCTTNHATYLLRHEGSTLEENSSTTPQNIQLYDISSISTQKQKKWIWWLATMSYRFALRLRHLETSSGSSPTLECLSESQKRSIRDRQRSLFQQTLDLLQDLLDIDGNAHESMVASVREHMADTYLSSSSAVDEASSSSKESPETRGSMSFKKSTGTASDFTPSLSPPVVTVAASSKVSPTTAAALSPKPPSVQPSTIPKKIVPAQPEYLPHAMPSSDSNKTRNQDRHHQQPYATVSIDKLNKAQDHLVRGIKTLSTLLDRDLQDRKLRRETMKRDQEMARKKSRRRQRQQQTKNNNDLEEKNDEERIPALSPAMIMQLFGMNFKLVNISLRLAEHHLGNYYSSSAMQALRAAARRLKDAAHLLDYYNMEAKAATTKAINNDGREEDEKRQESLQLQYIWLLEHCGHFARSFASDELWRDRGHASGEDIISVLGDVESVFVDNNDDVGPYYLDAGTKSSYESRFWQMVMQSDVLFQQSKGRISLQSLSGIVAPSIMNISPLEDAIQAAKGVLNKERILVRERRKVLVASCVYYSRAIRAFQYTVMETDPSEPPHDKMILLNLLRQRLGDACNETGKMLLAALRTLLVTNQGGKKNDGSQVSAEVLLDSAEFWFNQGLDAFEACKDTRNLALLRCNLCQSYKLRANSGFSKGNASASSKHAEDCLQEAADQLLTAHEDLGQRDVDTQTWDMVSEELAATFLVLGVRRRQSFLGSGNAPVIFQVMRLSPGEERSIVDPMERALKIYEQSDNAHQAAATHYQLALTFSKLWTCQLNEANTRKKLSKAFEHYSSAFTYFSNHSRGNEPTFCLLCLDLASLYAAIPGEEGLIKSLGCCLDCCDTFSVDAIKASTALAATAGKSTADWYKKMETITESVDDRVFKLLRNLVKIDPIRYKDLYREGLTAKMVRNVPEDEELDLDLDPKSAALLALHEVLLAIKKKYGAIVSK